MTKSHYIAPDGECIYYADIAAEIARKHPSLVGAHIDDQLAALGMLKEFIKSASPHELPSFSEHAGADLKSAVEKAERLGTDTARLFAAPLTIARLDLAEREEELERFRANGDTEGLAYRLCMNAANDALDRLRVVEASEVNRRLGA